MKTVALAVLLATQMATSKCRAIDWYQRSEGETCLAYSLGFAEKPRQTNLGSPTKTSARSPQAGPFFGSSSARQKPPSRSHESSHAAKSYRVSFDLDVVGLLDHLSWTVAHSSANASGIASHVNRR
jgi:hypothetical protein